MRKNRMALCVITAFTASSLIFVNASYASAVGTVQADTLHFAPPAPKKAVARYLKDVANAIVTDVAAIDSRSQDGYLIGSRMDGLAWAFRLLAYEIPPNVNASKYVSLAKDLSRRTHAAASRYGFDKTVISTDACSSGRENTNVAYTDLAEYREIRERARAVLEMVNQGLKTRFALPSLSATPGPTVVTDPPSSPRDSTPEELAIVQQITGEIVNVINVLDTRMQKGSVMITGLDDIAKLEQKLTDGPVPYFVASNWGYEGYVSGYKRAGRVATCEAKRAADAYAGDRYGRENMGKAFYCAFRSTLRNNLRNLNEMIHSAYELSELTGCLPGRR